MRKKSIFRIIVILPAFIFIYSCKDKDYSGDNTWLINRGEESLKLIIDKSKLVEIDLDRIDYDTLKVEQIINDISKEDSEKRLFLSSVNDILISNDSLLILDYRQNCIIISDLKGEFKSRIGRFGRGPGEYNNPYCFAMNNNYYFIYETNNGRIQILNRKFQYIKSINYDILPLGMNICASDQYLFVNSPHGIKPKSVETYRLDNLSLEKTEFVNSECKINDFVPEFSCFYDFLFAAAPNNSFAAGTTYMPFIILFDEKGEPKITIKFSGLEVKKLRQINNKFNTNRLLVRGFLDDLIYWDNYFFALLRNRYLLIFDSKNMNLKKSLVLEHWVSGVLAYSNSNLFITNTIDAKIYKYSILLK